MSAEFLTGLAMAALLIVAAAIATRPWWRRSAVAAPNRKAANVAAYRLRVDELDAEAAAGLIPADEAANLRRELDARLLDDAGDSAAEPAAQAARRPLAVIVVAVMLGLFAVAWYVGGGSWLVQREIAKGGEAPAIDPQVAAMVAKLEDRLTKSPEDAQGWALLGRSYFVMQRYEEAAKAYEQANARASSPSAEWLTDESEALAFAGNREISGRSAQLIEQALTLAPDYGKGLWYGGLAAAQRGDLALARTRWQTLLKAGDLPQPMREALEERLKSIDGASAAAGGDEQQAPGASSGETNAAVAPVAPGPALRVTVSLAPELTSKVPAGAVLFVFAKAESGPQIPLAVQRLQNAKLPLEITLDDTMAMAPTLRLSQFDRYVITARLSGSGGVQAQSGDLEGQISATRAQAGGDALKLGIDTVVP